MHSSSLLCSFCNCCRDAVIVIAVNCLTSLYAGFVVFSVLGYMADQQGLSVADVAQSGRFMI